MASFPSNVKTFTTRSAGQTIGSAHINDLQDEVNAIEDGLLNGTASIAPKNVQSGASTFARLTVDGTFQSSNSTFLGVVQGPAQPRCHLVSAATQSVDSTTVLAFNVEVFASPGLHDNAVNNSRITIPAGSSGVWWFAGQVLASTAAVVNLHLTKNSTRMVSVQRVVNGGTAETVPIMGLLSADAADYFELRAVATGSSYSVGSAVDAYQTRFQGVKVW